MMTFIQILTLNFIFHTHYICLLGLTLKETLWKLNSRTDTARFNNCPSMFLCVPIWDKLLDMPFRSFSSFICFTFDPVRLPGKIGDSVFLSRCDSIQSGNRVLYFFFYNFSFTKVSTNWVKPSFLGIYINISFTFSSLFVFPFFPEAIYEI